MSINNEVAKMFKWLVSGLLDAAEEYYSGEYLILRDRELATTV
ncbi:MAG: hypothetical protein QNJ64_19825 [Crocosphaera sp.]|nr:hypothetical protein [Crocosphaera sp.]